MDFLNRYFKYFFREGLSIRHRLVNAILGSALLAQIPASVSPDWTVYFWVSPSACAVVVMPANSPATRQKLSSRLSKRFFILISSRPADASRIVYQYMDTLQF